MGSATPLSSVPVPLVVPRPQRLTRGDAAVPRSVLDTPVVTIDPAAVPRAQGYRLTVSARGVEVVAHDAAGAFYGQQTLAQLRAGAGQAVPMMTVDDWPDRAVRGVMLDVSRDRVPKLAVIKQRIDRLARLKINQLQLYTEHTLAFAGHAEVWRDASPLTFDDLAEIEAYCNARFIDLVPCQNLFGHLHRWLTKPGYAHLAECPDGYDTPWGYRDPNPFSLDPSDPASFALSADLIDQIAAASGSKLFNIGCDETTDIGQGKNKARVQREGRAAVYLEYLQKLCARVSGHGQTPMFWGDIVLDHPELIEQVPQDAVLLNWGYEADHDFMGQGKQFQDAQMRFYVCPGTSSWCTLTGRTRNALGNLRAAAEAANTYGAEGYLITDWGDWGHWQPFALSWVGLTYGAGVAWALEANRDEHNLAAAVSASSADETDDTLGRVLMRLGNVYLQCEPKFPNSTWWFKFLRSPDLPDDAAVLRQVSAHDVRRVLTELGAVADDLSVYEPVTADGERMKREIDWCIRMTRWACERGGEIVNALATGALSERVDGGPEGAAALVQLANDLRTLWHEQSQPGGLEDSIEKLTRALNPAQGKTGGSF